MASITIRKLDSKTKQWLRIRAAKNGNSMEEEARLLFDESQSNESAPNSGPKSDNAKKPNIVPASVTAPIPSPIAKTNIAPDDSSAIQEGGILAGKQILLIISGGIAAY